MCSLHKIGDISGSIPYFPGCVADALEFIAFKPVGECGLSTQVIDDIEKHQDVGRRLTQVPIRIVFIGGGMVTIIGVILRALGSP